jgi:hypothetical protein
MTDQDGDLDRRLTDLFATADLGLAPRGDAATVVVTRVRRARRRRRAIQIAGPIAAVALLSVAVVSARPFHTPDPPPAHSVSGTGLHQELGMTGTAVGALRLGMSTAQAEATGLLVLPATNPGSSCLNYTGKDGILAVSLGSAGVSSIEVYTFIHTAEGAGIGDDYAKLQATYPSLPQNPDRGDSYRVPVPGQSGSWYVFGLYARDAGGRPITPTRASRIDTLSLRSSDSACPSG